MNGLKIESQGCSIPGQKRKHNEDFFAFHEPIDSADQVAKGNLYVVADGVGGAEIGEVASKYAVEKVLHEYYHLEEPNAAIRLKAAIRQANRDIFTHSERRGGRPIGTTLVAVLLLNDHLLTAHVGDSRAYLFREGRAIQLTKDHSLAQKLIEEGELTPDSVGNFRKKNVLMRSLGTDEEVLVEVSEPLPLQAGDVVLLCSDGLYNYFHKYEWDENELISFINWREPAEKIAATLAEAANQRGGSDNITALVIKVGVPSVATAMEPDEMPTEEPVRLHRKARPLAAPYRTKPRLRVRQDRLLFGLPPFFWAASGVGALVVALMLIGIILVKQTESRQTPETGPSEAPTQSTISTTDLTPTGFSTTLVTVPGETLTPATLPAKPQPTAPIVTQSAGLPIPKDQSRTWCMKYIEKGETFSKFEEGIGEREWWGLINDTWKLIPRDPFEPKFDFWYAFQIDPAKEACPQSMKRWEPPTTPANNSLD